MCICENMQDVEESFQDWVTRQWQKYIEYGELIEATANSDVRVLVAVTQAGQFGCVRMPTYRPICLYTLVDA